MNEDRARETLPETYRVALRLHELGQTDAQIAAVLRIDDRAVDALLRIARAKLDRLLAEPACQGERPEAVVVLVEEWADSALEHALDLARERRSTLHLVAADPCWGSRLAEIAIRAARAGVDALPHIASKGAEEGTYEVARSCAPALIVRAARDGAMSMSSVDRAERVGRCGFVVVGGGTSERDQKGS